MENKTKIIIAVSIIGVIALLVAGVIIFKVFHKNNSSQTQTGTQVQQENQKPTIDPKMQAQLDELDALRKQQGNVQLLSPEEIQKQLDELNTLHKQTNPKQTSLTQAEIQSQLQQLNTLKEANK